MSWKALIFISDLWLTERCVTGWWQELGGGSWWGLWRKALHMFHNLQQKLHIKHAFWVDGFYNILISLLQFCFKLHGFLRNFHIGILPQNRTQNSASTYLNLTSHLCSSWAQSSGHPGLLSALCELLFYPFELLVTLPETLFLPVKPYHPSRPWLKSLTLWSPSLLSAKIQSSSFLNSVLHLCWGVYYNLSHCLVSLKPGVPCDSLFHSKNIVWKTPWYYCICKYLVLVAKSCLTLCDPMDCSPSGFSVHGMSRARILEWVAISFSRGSSWPGDWIHICIGRWTFFFPHHWAIREACTCKQFSVFFFFMNEYTNYLNGSWTSARMWI